MRNKTIKTIGLCLTLFFSALFINAGDVKADGDGKGYAKCTYDFTEDRYNIKPYRYYRITIAFYKTGNEFNSYKSYATTSCSKSDEAYSRMYDNVCSIDNYTEIFHNALEYQQFFKKGITGSQNHVDPTWNCPSKIYLNRDNYNNNMSLYYIKEACDNKNAPWGCSRTAELKEKEIKQTGNIGDSSKKEDLWLDDKTGQLTDEKPVQTDSKDDSGVSIDKIVNWGNFGKIDGYNSNESNACDIISDKVIQWLSAFLTIICIVGIILLVVMSAGEFVKAITGSNEDGIKEAFKHTIIRVVCVVILLLLPMIISWILLLVNDNNYKVDKDGKYVIGTDGDPLCQVVK